MDERNIRQYSFQNIERPITLSRDLVEAVIEAGVNIEKLNYDSIHNQMIHPYGFLNLSNFIFTKSKYFLTSGQDHNRWSPDVFPFAITSKYLIYAAQFDFVIPVRTEVMLIVQNLENKEIVFEGPVNSNSRNAGLRKLVVDSNKLYYLDSLNNLHVFNGDKLEFN